MINPTEEIEITATEYIPQFSCKTYRYYNLDFYVNRFSLKYIYINKYAGEYYYYALNSFKAEVI